MRAMRREALVVFDSLTDREFGIVASLVRPRGITREQYRDCLARLDFDPVGFLENVVAMRAVAPQAWGLRAVR